MNRFFLLIIILVFSTGLSLADNTSAPTFSYGDPAKIAEREWKKLFDESVEWYNFGYFENALRGFKRLIIRDKNNSNVNFYIAMCHFYLHRSSDIIIPYLEKAVQKVNPFYSYSYKEKSAPVFSLLTLGQMYMYNYRIDDAIKVFNEFRGYLTEKNRDAFYIYEVERWLGYAQNAKLLIANPNTKISYDNLEVINSESNDYKPLVNDEVTKMYLSSERKGSTGGQYMQNTYKSDAYIVSFKNGKWSKPKKLGFRINTSSGEFSSGLSEGGLTYVFSREDKNNKDRNLYYCVVKGNHFSTPVSFNPNINTKSNEDNGVILINGNIMYFSSDKPGGFGGKDIYMVERMPNGEWGRPYNLGPTVNTSEDEDFPYILDDGVTLFFSSKGFNSMGGYDIFVTTLSEEGIWTTPENMGFPLNTTSDDIGFMMLRDGRRAFYSTAKGAHDNAYIDNLDIYELNFGD